MYRKLCGLEHCGLRLPCPELLNRPKPAPLQFTPFFVYYSSCPWSLHRITSPQRHSERSPLSPMWSWCDCNSYLNEASLLFERAGSPLVVSLPQSAMCSSRMFVQWVASFLAMWHCGSWSFQFLFLQLEQCLRDLRLLVKCRRYLHVGEHPLLLSFAWLPSLLSYPWSTILDVWNLA